MVHCAKETHRLSIFGAIARASIRYQSSSVLKVLNFWRIPREHEHMLENMLDLFVLLAFTYHL